MTDNTDEYTRKEMEKIIWDFIKELYEEKLGLYELHVKFSDGSLQALHPDPRTDLICSELSKEEEQLAFRRLWAVISIGKKLGLVDEDVNLFNFSDYLNRHVCSRGDEKQKELLS